MKKYKTYQIVVIIIGLFLCFFGRFIPVSSGLSASGAQTLTDLKEDRLKSAGAMVRAMKDMDKDTRDALFYAVGLLLRTNAQAALEDWQQEGEKKRNAKKKEKHQ